MLPKINKLPVIVLSSLFIFLLFYIDDIYHFLSPYNLKDVVVDFLRSFSSWILFYVHPLVYAILPTFFFSAVVYYVFLSYNGYLVKDDLSSKYEEVKTLTSDEKKYNLSIDKPHKDVISYKRNTYRLLIASVICFFIIFVLHWVSLGHFDESLAVVNAQMDAIRERSPDSVVSIMPGFQYLKLSVINSNAYLYYYVVPMSLLFIAVLRTLLSHYYHAYFYRFNFLKD